LDGNLDADVFYSGDKCSEESLENKDNIIEVHFHWSFLMEGMTTLVHVILREYGSYFFCFRIRNQLQQQIQMTTSPLILLIPKNIVLIKLILCGLR